MERLFTIAVTLSLLSIVSYAQIVPSAEQVLTQMLSVYATCNSYSDEGRVETVFITKDRTWTVTKPFTTAFIRNSSFYFEYQEQFPPSASKAKWKKYMVWEDQEGAHQWSFTDPVVRQISSLGLALAGPTGVSGLAAYNIPYLLKDDLKKPRIHRFQRIADFRVVGEETVDGKVAYKLDGTDRHPQMKDPIQPMTIWVEKESYLLLKIYQKLTLQDKDSKNFDVETTTLYHPQINIEIPKEKFKVTIPVGEDK